MTRRARILVPGDPSAVAFARDRVITQVRAWGVPLDAELRYAVKLVTSELITNAVVHAEGLITVGLYLNEEWLLLVVHDSDSRAPQQQKATAEDEGGRGLALVESFAARNGWEPTADGKKVWAEFEVPPSPPATRAEQVRRRVRSATSRRNVNAVAALFAIGGCLMGGQHAAERESMKMPGLGFIAAFLAAGLGPPTVVLHGQALELLAPPPVAVPDVEPRPAQLTCSARNSPGQVEPGGPLRLPLPQGEPGHPSTFEPTERGMT